MVLKRTLSSSFNKVDLTRELLSLMATYKCEAGSHQDMAEYEKNPAGKAANPFVKQLFGNGEEQ